VGAKSAFQDFLRLKIQMKRGPESMIQYVKMFYFGFQDTHESKLKNKREGPPQVKVKKGRRERGEGKGGKTKKEATEM
jgi:hypothetical protein